MYECGRPRATLPKCIFVSTKRKIVASGHHLTPVLKNKVCKTFFLKMHNEFALKARKSLKVAGFEYFASRIAEGEGRKLLNYLHLH